MTSAEFITKWNARFPDNLVGEIEESDLREFSADIAETFGYVPPTATSLGWDENVTYNTAGHAEPNAYAEYSDRLYRTKQDGNLGHTPPTAKDVDGIIQDDWWIEVSRAESSPIKEWTAGAYGSGLIIVLFNDKFYKLNVPERPFESTNIETEITAEQWTIVGGSGDGGPAVAGKYPTWALLLADQQNQKSGFVYFATDASGFSTVDAGYAYFEYLGTTAGDESDYRKLTEGESLDLDLSGKVDKESYTILITAAAIELSFVNYLNKKILTLDQNTTLSFASLNGKEGSEYKLIVIQNETGGWSVTFPAEVDWGDLLGPVLLGDPNTREIEIFFEVESETKVRGSYRYLHG